MVKQISYPITIGSVTFDAASREVIPMTDFTGSELVMTFNALSEIALTLGVSPDKAKTVNKFESRVVTEKRIAMIHSAVLAGIESSKAIAEEGKTRGNGPAVTEGRSEVTEQNNEAADAAAKAKADAKTVKAEAKAEKATKAAKDKEAVKEAKADVKAKKAAEKTKAKEAAKSAAKKTNGARGRSTSIPDGATLHKIVEGNPKRVGSAQAEFWGWLRDGMTMGAYRKKFAEEKDANSRIGFDVKRGLVRIEMPAA